MIAFSLMELSFKLLLFSSSTEYLPWNDQYPLQKSGQNTYAPATLDIKTNLHQLFSTRAKFLRSET